MKGFIPSTREETHAAEQRRKLAEKRIEETDAGGGALKAWRGGVTQTCRSELLCDAAGVGELCCHLSTGSPFGHHPRLSMGCPRWGQRVNTRDTQLNYIPAYRLCSCGYSRSLLRRSPLSMVCMLLWIPSPTAPPPHPHPHRVTPPAEAHHA